MPVNLEISAVATGLEKVSFHSNAKKCSNYCTVALISHSSKVILKIPHSRLQQDMHCDFQMFKLDLEKAEEWKTKLPTSAGSSKMREFQKSIHFCFIDYTKAFDCVDHNKLWKILKEMGIPDHLTCLLWNLYAGQERTIRTGHGTTDWFQIGKGVHQGYVWSPCLLNICRVHHAKCQAGWSTSFKVGGRNINNLRHANDTTLMAESEEELKGSWWKWKRRVKKLS